MVVAFLLFHAHCSNKCKEREAFKKILVVFVSRCKKKRTRDEFGGWYLYETNCPKNTQNVSYKIREHFGGILVKMFPMALAYLGARPEARSVW